MGKSIETKKVKKITFGEAVVRMRRRRGLSQKYLAAACRIDPATLNRIENEKRRASLPLKRRIMMKLAKFPLLRDVANKINKSKGENQP